MALGDGTTWDETLPTDNTIATLIDDHIRDVRVGVRSRLAQEHEWPASQGSTAAGGVHKFITMQTLTAAPTLAGTQTGAVYVTGTGASADLQFANSGGTKSIGAITGEVRMWGGTIATVPSGWLFCNGAVVSQTTYAALYAVIGHQYAADPGSGNFTLPDMRNLYAVGANADDVGVAKSTANYDAIAYKTKTGCNQFYTTNDTPSGGGGAAKNGVFWNGVEGNGQSAARQPAYPNYVAFAYMIKT